MNNAHAQSANGDARLHIAIVTETYPPEINGVANTMHYLVKGLAGRGHRIELVRPRQRADRRRGNAERTVSEAAPAVTLNLVPGFPIPGYRELRFGLPVFWRLRRRWARRTPNLVYIATQGPLGFAALSAAQRNDVPAVTGFHTQFHQYSQHYGLGLLTHAIIDTLQQFHNRSDTTLVPTRDLQRELTAAGFNDVHVFGRGVDVERFSPGRRSEALRQSWGCGPDDLVVIHVGRIAAEKNLALAVRAFMAIRAEHPRARFVLVGDGPERAQIHQEHPDFIFAGARTGDDLAAHYASGDLFLFPSLTETFGNVVTEAMASGLAIVAFDYAAAHTHLRDGGNGMTVPLRDDAAFIAAACAVCSDRARLRAMGQAARASAEDIGWDRVMSGVEQRLFQVIRQRRDAENSHATMAAKSH